jgi:hypothetical protein
MGRPADGSARPIEVEVEVEGGDFYGIAAI